MADELKYFDSSSFLWKEPSVTMREDFAENLLDHYEEATTYRELEQETDWGKLVFEPIKLRIIQTINPTTGENMGDDFRTLLFNAPSPITTIGKRYRIGQNIWITYNSMSYESTHLKTYIRRCDNTMNFIDENGIVVREPCYVSYYVNNTKTRFNADINTPQMDITVTAQTNDITRKFKINDKFMFHGQTYTITAINRIANETTFGNNATNNITDFYMSLVALSAYDDVENNIANGLREKSSIKILSTDINGKVGDKASLSVEVIINNDIQPNANIIWESSNELIATINNGNVELVGVGDCIITAKYTDNQNLYDSISVSVLPNDAQVPNDYQINIIPNAQYIIQGETTIFKFNLINNGKNVDCTFRFVTSGVNPQKYNAIEIGDNSIQIQNNNRDDNPLKVTAIAINASDETIYQQTFNFELRGYF